MGRVEELSFSELVQELAQLLMPARSELTVPSPATLTGSIGIFAIIPTVDKTLGKIGVNVDGVGTSPLASQMRIDRPLGAEARALLQATIERGYDPAFGNGLDMVHVKLPGHDPPAQLAHAKIANEYTLADRFP